MRGSVVGHPQDLGVLVVARGLDALVRAVQGVALAVVLDVASEPELDAAVRTRGSRSSEPSSWTSS